MAQILFLVILATAFSSALPLALPLCAAYLLLRHLTERLYFVKHYTRTPAYDAKLFHAAYALLPLALVGKLVATAVLYADTPDGAVTFYLQLLVFLFWLSVDRGLWPWLLSLRKAGAARGGGTAGAPQPVEAEADLAESTSHQLGRLRGSLASYDPFPQAFSPPVLSAAERAAWAPCARWDNPKRLPVFATCPNCFGHVAIDRDAPSATHRCRAVEPPSGSMVETEGLLLPPAEVARRRLLQKEASGDLGDAAAGAAAQAGVVPQDAGVGERAGGQRPAWPDAPALAPRAGASTGAEARAARRLAGGDWWAPAAAPARTAPGPQTERARLLWPEGIDTAAAGGDTPRGATAGDDCTGSDVAGTPPHAIWSRLPRLGGASALRAFGSWDEARAWMENQLRVPERAGPLGPSADDVPADGGERYTYTGVPTLLLPPVAPPRPRRHVVIRDFWNAKLGCRTVHAGGPWAGEVPLGVQFVALARTGALPPDGPSRPPPAPPAGFVTVHACFDERRGQTTALRPEERRRGAPMRQAAGSPASGFDAWADAQPGLGTVPIFEFEHVHTKRLT
eukprot:scaffold26991_cov79-Isochrysis_galbana.AAC.1